MRHVWHDRRGVALSTFFAFVRPCGHCHCRSCTVIDPTEREELCLDGAIVVGANKRQEVCALHCSGSVVLKKQQVLKCVSKAIQRAADLNELIRSVIVDDREKR